MTTYKLIGSASDLYSLLENLKKNWYWSEAHAIETDVPEIFSVASSKGLMEGLRIIKKGRRYRLEIAQLPE